MLKSTRSIAHIVCQNEENRQQLFLDRMKDFPCSFNLGCSDLDIGDKPYMGLNIIEPDLRKYNCEYFKQNIEDTEGEDFEEVIWRENLLTRVHAELGDISMALMLNKKILKHAGTRNLVAVGNLAFLYHLLKDVEKVNAALTVLNKIKETPHYKDLKVRAILEQAYEYRKFGGAKYLLCSMALFDFALPLGPQDERLQFMRAMVYRRCTHFGIYIEDPENIDYHQFGHEAAKELVRLGNEARDRVIRSAALIELAYLKHNDDTHGRSSDNKSFILDEKEWFAIVGDMDWKTLCMKAVLVSGGNLTEKVLKIAGQLFRYFGCDEYLQLSEEFLKGAVEIKPTNRAYHHLGLTYRKMAINFERTYGLAQRNQMDQWQTLQNNSVKINDFVQIDWIPQWSPSQDNNVTGINLLPQPPENTRPQDSDKHLISQLKVPGEEIKPFSENNPYTMKAVEQFKKAIEASHEHNIPTIYDLGYMYAQMGLFDESKKTCLKLIEACKNHYSGVQYLTYVVNAYNLYGMCCAMEAERTGDDARKMSLIKENEDMLVQAVRMASFLAAGTPELATAVTDLWHAFNCLERKFDFEGGASSKEKLFQLYELGVGDYRYIEKVNKILSKDPSAWENVNVLEKHLECYLNLGDIDGAFLFLDQILHHPEATFRRENSPTVQKLMFEVAKRTLSRSLAQIQGAVTMTLPDLIWKQMFHASFDTNNIIIKYDIIIVQDITDDNEPKSGTRSDRTAGCLQDILANVCGLNVVRHHEEVLPGDLLLEQYINTISRSHVAIFVLPDPRNDSLTLKACLERTLTVGDAESESVILGAQSKAVNLQSLHEPHSLSNSQPAGMENNLHEHHTDNPAAEAPMSNVFNYIISTCTQKHLNERKPSHIVPVCLGDMQPEDLPLSLQGLSSLYLSDTDIDRLSSALRDDVCDETVNLIMTIFKAIIRKQ